MKELRKGQVVACWQGDNYCKVICIFVRKKKKFTFAVLCLTRMN